MLRVCWDQSSLAEEEEVLEVLAVQPEKQELDLEWMLHLEKLEARKVE